MIFGKNEGHLSKNVFDVGFTVKGGRDPHSKILEKIHVFERFLIYFTGGGGLLTFKRLNVI